MDEHMLSTRYKWMERLPVDVVSALQKLPSVQMRIEFLNGVMQQIIDSGDGRQRSQFWDVRKLCLEEFKEPLPSAVRILLWAQYSRLCQEARKLKAIFDEQSAFTIQQIDQAIAALEDEFLSLPKMVESVETVQEIEQCAALRHNSKQYSFLQKEVSLLSLLILRAVSLKKEIHAADLRIKQKRDLLQRLSDVHESIFTWKKKAVQAISTLFMDDMQNFLQKEMGHLLKELFAVKEILQQLQHCSKILTLTSKTFNCARMALSERWDMLQQLIADQKEAVHDRHEMFKNNKKKILSLLDEALAQHQSGGDVSAFVLRITKEIENIDLSYSDERMLREKIGALKALLVIRDDRAIKET